MNGGTLDDLIFAVSGLVALIAPLVAGGKWLARTGRKISDLHDAWYGEPARPGVPARLGVMERLAAQDAHLERQDEHLAAQDQHLERQDIQIASIREALDRLERHGRC